VSDIPGVTLFFSPVSRKDDSHRDHCGALVYTFVFMLILFLGEVMMVISADNPSLPWRAAFTPLYLLTGLSAGMIWWIIYKRRSCEVIDFYLHVTSI
jgi:hypothetical protein